MLKQRIWAIEIRPYVLNSTTKMITVINPNTKLWYFDPIYGAYLEPKGNKEGVITLDVSSGMWTEWSRSYSFQELRENSKIAISKFGKDNVRIVEIHDIELITLPNV